MTSLLLTLGSIVVSYAALLVVRSVDPKRRRVTGQDAVDYRLRYTCGWLFAVLPLGPLVLLGNVAAVFCWFAAMTVIGWSVALQRPRAWPGLSGHSRKK